MLKFVSEYIRQKYETREKEMGEDSMRRLETMVLLRTIDELWMDHIEQLDHLKQSVSLRGYGQRDPLVEYKIEAQSLFQQLQESIKAQVVNLIFKVSFVQQPKAIQMQESRPDAVGESRQQVNEPLRQGSGQAVSTEPKIGRNDPCPCGSGKKYKKCHLNRKD